MPFRAAENPCRGGYISFGQPRPGTLAKPAPVLKLVFFIVFSCKNATCPGTLAKPAPEPWPNPLWSGAPAPGAGAGAGSWSWVLELDLGLAFDFIFNWSRALVMVFLWLKVAR